MLELADEAHFRPKFRKEAGGNVAEIGCAPLAVSDLADGFSLSQDHEDTVGAAFSPNSLA
jgi:hypothetical protein